MSQFTQIIRSLRLRKIARALPVFFKKTVALTMALQFALLPVPQVLFAEEATDSVIPAEAGIQAGSEVAPAEEAAPDTNPQVPLNESTPLEGGQATGVDAGTDTATSPPSQGGADEGSGGIADPAANTLTMDIPTTTESGLTGSESPDSSAGTLTLPELPTDEEVNPVNPVNPVVDSETKSSTEITEQTEITEVPALTEEQ